MSLDVNISTTAPPASQSQPVTTDPATLPQPDNSTLTADLPNRRTFFKSLLTIAEGAILLCPPVRYTTDRINTAILENRLSNRTLTNSNSTTRGVWPYTDFVYSHPNGTKIRFMGTAHVEALVQQHFKILIQVAKHAHVTLLESSKADAETTYFRALSKELETYGCKVRLLEEASKTYSIWAAKIGTAVLCSFVGATRIIHGFSNLIWKTPLPRRSFGSTAMRSLAWIGATFFSFPSLITQAGETNNSIGKFLRENDPSMITEPRSIGFLSCSLEQADKAPNQGILVIIGDRHAQDIRRFTLSPEGMESFEARRKIYGTVYKPFVSMKLD